MSILNRPQAFDPVTGIPVGETFDDYRIHGGWSFRATAQKLLAPAGPNQVWRVFLLTTPAPYVMHMTPTVKVTAEMTIEYYEHPIGPTGGVPLNGVNLNRNHTRVSGAEAWGDVSVTSDGDLLQSIRCVPSQSLSEEPMEAHWVLKPSTGYLVKAIAHGQGYATLIATWHEWKEMGNPFPH